MKLVDDFLPVNKYTRSGFQRPDTLAVVLHWPEAPGQTAKNVRDYFYTLSSGKSFHGKPKYASTQYIINMDGTVLRTMPDEEVAYHCGNGGKIDPVSGLFYTDIARALFIDRYLHDPYSPSYASIGIEMCHYEWDGKWTDDTLEATAELVKSLFNRYPKLIDPYTQIITHNQVVGHKSCPKWFCEHPDDLKAFRARVDSLLG
jgi:N-acetylmuramoyl-L-alanine amidase CwlA